MDNTAWGWWRGNAAFDRWEHGDFNHVPVSTSNHYHSVDVKFDYDAVPSLEKVRIFSSCEIVIDVNL